MTANTNPIFTVAPVTGWGSLTAANTNYDGTGTVSTLYTAGSNGGYVERIRFKALGTNVATLARIFINNGSTNTTAANNSLFKEIPLPASTSSNTSPLMEYDFEMNLAIPAGYKVNWTLATAVAAGIQATLNGGDY